MSDGEKRGVGRPTKYDPRYVEELIAFNQSGKSFTSFCGSIGIAKSTGAEWRKANPEFEAAFQIGQAVRHNTLETELLATDKAAVVNARQLALRSADREEWDHKLQHEHTGPNGGPIMTVDMAALASLSDKELDDLERARGIIDRIGGAIASSVHGSDQGGTGASEEEG